MRHNLYESGDTVLTSNGKGVVNEDQQARESTVLVQLLGEDDIQVYDIDDVSLINSIH